jgi:hypothetical protein
MKFVVRLLAALLFVTALGRSQMLAHKGWAGSGMTVDPWWQGAIFYTVDATSDGTGGLSGLAERLPYLQSLGVDAIILSPSPLAATGASQPIAPAFGTAEDFDHLEAEAGRRKIRIVVDLPLKSNASLADTDSVARFWLSRGVAGLRLVRTAETPADPTNYLRDLRRVTSSYGGQRLLLWDAGELAVTDPQARRLNSRRGQLSAGPDLIADRHLETLRSLGPSVLRVDLAGRSAGAAVATDSAESPRSVARVSSGSSNGADAVPVAKLLAAALLAGRGAPLLYSGQEIGSGVSADNIAVQDADTKSLLNWYRKLAELHHGNAALRTGSFDLVPTSDADLVIWVRRPRVGGSPVLAVLNTSSTAHLTSLGVLAPELQRLGIRGAMLKTLATTEPEGTAQTANAISLSGFGVFLGEIRSAAGLETVVLPVRRRVHRSRHP